MSDDLTLFDVGGMPVHVPAPRPQCVVDPSLEPDADAERRFWSHVVKSRSCWWWTGAISSPDGYGRVTWRRANRQRSVSAHRFALLLDDPELRADAVAEHACNMPLCVRVGDGHLHVGTQASNVAYAVSTGRHRGRRPVAPVGQLAQSLAIREWLANGGDPDSVPWGVSPGRDDPMLF